MRNDEEKVAREIEGRTLCSQGARAGEMVSLLQYRAQNQDYLATLHQYRKAVIPLQAIRKWQN
jgi:hypothetical protein